MELGKKQILWLVLALAASLAAWALLNGSKNGNLKLDGSRLSISTAAPATEASRTGWIPLANASANEMLKAFVFSTIAPFPKSNLIYVQRGFEKTDEAHLVDHTGKVIATVDYSAPQLSEYTEDDLYPARRNYRWGYINGRGEWAIQPKYKQADRFKYGAAKVVDENGDEIYVNTKAEALANFGSKIALIVAKDWIITRDHWVLRDTTGIWSKTAHQFSAVAPFNERVVIGTRDKKMMLVSRDGTLVGGSTFDQIKPAVNGQAPAMKNGKWGSINENSEWVLEPKYDEVSITEAALYRVVQQGKVQYMNAKGDLLLGPEYRQIGNISEGLIPACADMRCGYLNLQGQWGIDPQFEEVSPFSEGYARVVKNGLVAFIDHHNHFLTPDPPIQAFAPWLWRPETIGTSAASSGGPYVAYIDREGEYLLSLPSTSSLVEFSDSNPMPVKGANGKFGYINAKAEWVIPPLFREAGQFLNGTAPVAGSFLLSSDRGFIDRNRHEQSGVVIEPQHAEKPRKKEALAIEIAAIPQDIKPLSIDGGNWGYADAKDQFVIDPQFEDADDFEGGYAAVKKDGEWGFIDRTGKLVVQPIYEKVEPFSNGTFHVKRGDEEEWRYIDEHGKLALPNSFTDVNTPDIHPLSINGGKWGYADRKDHFVISPEFESVNDFEGGYAAVKLNGKWGIINSSGELVVKAEYEEVGHPSEGLCAVKTHTLWSYINEAGKTIIPENFTDAGEFHNGRAKVGINAETVRLSITTGAINAPRMRPNWPTMLSEATNISQGISAIKLAPAGYQNSHFEYYYFALMNKNGEIWIPADTENK